MKISDGIVIPSLKSERKQLTKPGQYGLVIMNVFLGFLGITRFFAKRFHQTWQVTSSIWTGLSKEQLSSFHQENICSLVRRARDIRT